MSDLVDVHGDPIRRHVEFTVQEAQLLRSYRRFLEKHHLKEALYCGKCWERELSDGCKAFVRPEAIMIQCRCTERTFDGATI